MSDRLTSAHQMVIWCVASLSLAGMVVSAAACEQENIRNKNATRQAALEAGQHVCLDGMMP